MPIAREAFESYDPDDPTNAECVLAFLEAHPEQAFKALEIAEATGVHEHSIHPVLGRLADDGELTHKSPYWALADADGRRDRRNRQHERGRERDHERKHDHEQGRNRDYDRDGWPKSAVRRYEPDR